MIGNIIVPQDFADRIGTKSEPSYDAFSRFTGSVSLDDIVDVNIRNFAGHVYNLETPTGWYVANDSVAHKNTDTGIIVHNCRCTCAASLLDSYSPSQWKPNMELVDRLMSDPDMAFWPKLPASLRMQMPWTTRLDLSQKRIDQIGKAAATLADTIGKQIGIDERHGIDEVVARFQKTRPKDGYLSTNEQRAVTQFQNILESLM
jgi:hypothetical protein